MAASSRHYLIMLLHSFGGDKLQSLSRLEPVSLHSFGDYCRGDDPRVGSGARIPFGKSSEQDKSLWLACQARRLLGVATRPGRLAHAGWPRGGEALATKQAVLHRSSLYPDRAGEAAAFLAPPPEAGGVSEARSCRNGGADLPLTMDKTRQSASNPD